MVTISLITEKSLRHFLFCCLFQWAEEILLLLIVCPCVDCIYVFRIIGVYIGNTGHLLMLVMFKGKFNYSSGVSSHLATEGKLELLQKLTGTAINTGQNTIKATAAI